ncbi:MAG: PGPGW domain-containing protein [Ignavibacteriales bacterium]|nr:PGPGW domain-containing protein [Ignavibacteriales bacterium]
MTVKSLKRIFIAIVGSTVLLIGIVMIFLPGPSILVIPAGLGILATEFVWAKVLLNKMKEKIFKKKKPPQNE